MNNFRWISLVILGMSLTGSLSMAQVTADEFNVVEEELVNEAPPIQHQQQNTSAIVDDSSNEKNELKSFNELGNLAPFNEISVIQRRFMPKTERFQLFAGGTLVTNDPFFMSLGFSLKGSYFFNESWAVELNYVGLTTMDRKVTEDLKDLPGGGIQAESLVYSKSYMGADVMFVPIYGKLAWLNNKIIPYDLYFTLGAGKTSLRSGESPTTIHIGTGQIFSMSKAFAFRWDFSWNFFQASAIDGSKSNFNNLFLTVGVSWFFPEAKYR